MSNDEKGVVLDSGYDGGGLAHQRIFECISSPRSSEYEYLVTISSASNPGRLGGKVRWSVIGTNNIKNLFDHLPDTSSSFYERNEAGIFVEINKREVALSKWNSLKEEEQFYMIRELLIDRMLGKI